MQLLKVKDLVRVGHQHDGGYVISEALLQRSQVLLSFGINDDWSFEEDFCSRCDARCYGFDFSIYKGIFRERGMQQIRFFFGDILKRRKWRWQRIKEARHQFDLEKRFGTFFTHHQFFSYGIDNRTHGAFKDLSTILEEQCSNKKDIFLKVDIEGYEYAIIDDILQHKDRFHAIAMEIHNIHDDTKGFPAFIDKIRDGFYIYHVHANNYGKMEKKGGMPDAIEISCIRKDIVASPLFYEDLSHLPLEGIDFPNDPETVDFKW